jgi:hypothetical protein
MGTGSQDHIISQFKSVENSGFENDMNNWILGGSVTVTSTSAWEGSYSLPAMFMKIKIVLILLLQILKVPTIHSPHRQVISILQQSPIQKLVWKKTIYI